MRIRILNRYAAVFFYLISAMLANVVQAGLADDGMRVYYVHKKNGSHIGFQVWEGTQAEHNVLRSYISDMVKDESQLDSVTVAPVYPNRCAVLYSRLKKNGKTKYFLSETHKSLQEAREFAKEKSDADYRILDVACSPGRKELLSNANGAITCPDGSNLNYKFIIPPKTNKRMAVILRSGGSTIVLSESDLKRIDEQRIISLICPDKTISTSYIGIVDFKIVSYLKELERDNCVEKHGSEKACDAWMAVQRSKYDFRSFLTGVRG